MRRTPHGDTRRHDRAGLSRAAVSAGSRDRRHARRDVPETPRYDTLANSAQRWRDLAATTRGSATSASCCRAVDDRYVIMNAGDELRLRFRRAGAAARGLDRDFVLIGDGWEKDGDYNTTFSKTVLPLPTHGIGRLRRRRRPMLEDDPVYRAHPRRLAARTTRGSSTPDAFLSGLR